MTSITKPKIAHPSLPRNELGLTRRDYEGGMSTLCAGCGHDSITAAITEAVWGLSLRPEQLVKLSGIGCSSKTTAYFVSGAHGFNGVHGRMPSIATGANAANHDLTYIGVSGDGDSLSIGLGQLAHAIRRNVNMLYIIENNGVYGLTKGQFSASADIGTKAKKGEVNHQPPIDPVLLALNLGAGFVARSFSGDKRQLVPLIQVAELTGVAGISFVVVWFAVAVSGDVAAMALNAGRSPHWRLGCLIPLGLAALVSSWGSHGVGLRFRLKREWNPIKLALIQPSIPQTMIWNPAEKTNLAEEKPDVVKRMQADLDQWRRGVRDSFDGKDYE